MLYYLSKYYIIKETFIVCTHNWKKKRGGSIKNLESGLTLIELIISISIIGIIAITFIPLFITTAQINKDSETVLDATYIGRDTMELVYDLSKKIAYEDLEKELGKRGFKKGVSKDTFKRRYDGETYSVIELDKEKNLVKVMVEVYKENKGLDKLEAQYESLYIWK